VRCLDACMERPLHGGGEPSPPLPDACISRVRVSCEEEGRGAEEGGLRRERRGRGSGQARLGRTAEGAAEAANELARSLPYIRLRVRQPGAYVRLRVRLPAAYSSLLL
jgi:hypothetical protein